ncbi:MAG: recombinase family protein [Chloroflexi bacterium]|nr:recombinase family protein [Chloroflexota bacterium]
MKAIGYFRAPAPGSKSESLAAQNKAFLEFCDRLGYDVEVTFVETVGGNGGGQRPGFRQLVDYLRRPEKGFLLVVARSLEGLGGDPKESVRRYFQLEGLGVQVTFLSGDGDPLDEIVGAWAGQSSSAKLSERVRAAMRKKAVRGEVLGRPPYGYRVGNRRRLELVPEEAVVVRHIFRLYLQEGLGIRLIAGRLNEEGQRTRRGGNWSMVSIRDILRNRVYLGTYARFGVRVPGSHPALVTPDDFRAVQDRLVARRNNYSQRQPSPFLLAGLVQCGHCQNKMIGVSRRQSWRRRSGGESKASYRYYQCGSRTNQSMCDYHTQRAQVLEEHVRDAIAGSNGDVVHPEAGNEEAVLAEWQHEATRGQGRLRRLDRRLDEHLSAAANGRITREQFHKLSVATAAERLSQEDALGEIDRRMQEQADASKRRRGRERALARLLDGWETLPMAEKQSLLRELVARVVVRDEGLQVLLRP